MRHLRQSLIRHLCRHLELLRAAPSEEEITRAHQAYFEAKYTDSSTDDEIEPESGDVLESIKNSFLEDEREEEMRTKLEDLSGKVEYD